MTQIPVGINALPAIPVSMRTTSAANAWLGPYQTVQLIEPIAAVRVHVGAGPAASIHEHLAAGAGLHGRWFAIGDVVQTYQEYQASRALPGHFTEIAIVTLAAGSVVNVGRCGPLFGRRGGGEQIEFVEGPTPTLRPLDATWSHTAGNA